ncbi:MAG: hypothetical protein ABIY70_25580 [Capsulimonas sp.]|uniref:hypothetical protein n=1 Tax=Capsulimonas sp. TaxID=2494211 RepID=UPI0032642F58
MPLPSSRRSRLDPNNPPAGIDPEVWTEFVETSNRIEEWKYQEEVADRVARWIVKGIIKVPLPSGLQSPPNNPDEPTPKP